MRAGRQVRRRLHGVTGATQRYRSNASPPLKNVTVPPGVTLEVTRPTSVTGSPKTDEAVDTLSPIAAVPAATCV
jgi:hypothetical protein